MKLISFQMFFLFTYHLFIYLNHYSIIKLFIYLFHLGACVMVGHLRGRQLNPSKIETYRADVSQRLLRRKENSEGFLLFFYLIFFYYRYCYYFIFFYLLIRRVVAY